MLFLVSGLPSHQAGPSQLTCTKPHVLSVVMLQCRRRTCGYGICSLLTPARPTAHLPLPFMAKAESSSYLHPLSLQRINENTTGKVPSLPSLPMMHASHGTRFLPLEWRNPRQRFSPPWWACLCQAAGCFMSPTSAGHTSGDKSPHGGAR